MEQDRKVYETYVVNLDNSRLFWLSVIFLMFLCLAFLAGLFIGRKLIAAVSMKTASEPVQETQSVSFDNVLLSTSTEQTQYSNLEFYRVLPKERLTSADIEHSIPFQKKKQELKPGVEMQKPSIVETRFPEVGRSPAVSGAGSRSSLSSRPPAQNPADTVRRSVTPPGPGEAVPRVRNREGLASRPAPVRPSRTGENIVSGPGRDRTRPYAIQVASYQNGSTAEAVRAQLESDHFIAFIVRTKINNRLYFRIRLGPFSSRTKADAVLDNLRGNSGFSGAYVCGD